MTKCSEPEGAMASSVSKQRLFLTSLSLTLGTTFELALPTQDTLEAKALCFSIKYRESSMQLRICFKVGQLIMLWRCSWLGGRTLISTLFRRQWAYRNTMLIRLPHLEAWNILRTCPPTSLRSLAVRLHQEPTAKALMKLYTCRCTWLISHLLIAKTKATMASLLHATEYSRANQQPT